MKLVHFYGRGSKSVQNKILVLLKINAYLWKEDVNIVESTFVYCSVQKLDMTIILPFYKFVVKVEYLLKMNDILHIFAIIHKLN